MSPRGTLHLLIGPVGAGKTTYAQRRIARTPAVFLDLDAWMVRLFGADPQIVPPEIFERASDVWEPPTEAERAAWPIVDE